MLTSEERVRALLGNLKNHDWQVHGPYRIDKEDGAALLEVFRDMPTMQGVYAESHRADG